MKTTESSIRARLNHHQSLEALYVETTNELVASGFGLKLWRKLNRLEQQMNKAATDLCNIPDFQDRYDSVKEQVRDEVSKLFGGTLPDGFMINGDPRGYSLKLDSEARPIPEKMYKDWGGYGILAPQID